MAGDTEASTKRRMAQSGWPSIPSVTPKTCCGRTPDEPGKAALVIRGRMPLRGKGHVRTGAAGCQRLFNRTSGKRKQTAQEEPVRPDRACAVRSREGEGVKQPGRRRSWRSFGAVLPEEPGKRLSANSQTTAPARHAREAATARGGRPSRRRDPRAGPIFPLG